MSDVLANTFSRNLPIQTEWSLSWKIAEQVLLPVPKLEVDLCDTGEISVAVVCNTLPSIRVQWEQTQGNWTGTGGNKPHMPVFSSGEPVCEGLQKLTDFRDEVVLVKLPRPSTFPESKRSYNYDSSSLSRYLHMGNFSHRFIWKPFQA